MHEYKAKVTKVYDGDTITVDIDLGFEVWMKNQKIRLYGINTPEVRGPEKEEGKMVRDIVRKMILDKTVIIKTSKAKKGKYGRWLGEVYFMPTEEFCKANNWNYYEGCKVNVNDYLINSGLAEEKHY